MIESINNLPIVLFLRTVTRSGKQVMQLFSVTKRSLTFKPHMQLIADLNFYNLVPFTASLLVPRPDM